MRTQTTDRPANPTGEFESSPANVRIKLSALWAAMLFVFAYIDIFSQFRPDVRAQMEAGEVSGFTINDAFLTATTVYVLIPSLMVFGALVLQPRINRNRQRRAGQHLRADDRRRSDRRMELLHPRQRRRGRIARVDHLLRVDLAEDSPVGHRRRD